MPPDAIVMRFFAKVYGFTRRQVLEEMSLEDMEWFPRIERAEAEAEEIRRKQEARAAKAHHRG